MQRLRERLSADVPAASLAVFRILFGLAGAVASARFVAKGWVDELLVAPTHHLHYPGFGFVVEPPREVLLLLFATMFAASLAIAAGLFLRIAAATYFLAFTYVESIDQALYLNHHYAIGLIALLLVVLPLGDAHSLDARRRGGTQITFPLYALFAIRLQLGLVYFFAGVAKLQPDWLLRAEPLSTWLAANADIPLLGRAFAYRETAFVMSWAGALFDLGIPFLLSMRRTRPFAYAAVVGFHVITGLLFDIGLFPWLMIAFTTVFFEPDWPIRVGRSIASRASVSPPSDARPSRAGADRSLSRGGFVALVLWFVVQLALPLRHLANVGNHLWTYEGFNFAWHVMIVEKGAHADLYVVDRASGRRALVEPDDYYTPQQIRTMSEDPALVVQFAHLVASEWRRAGHADVAVYARSYAALNGRAAQTLVDPAIDLTTVDEWTPTSRYVVPLREGGRFQGFELEPESPAPPR